MKKGVVKITSGIIVFICCFCLTACDMKNTTGNGEGNPIGNGAEKTKESQTMVVAKVCPAESEMDNISEIKMDDSKALIEKRLGDVNIFDYVVTSDYDEKSLTIEIPKIENEGNVDYKALFENVIRTGKLSFYEIEPYTEDVNKKNNKDNKDLLIYTELGGEDQYKRVGAEIMNGQDVSKAEAVVDDGGDTVVSIELSGKGRKKFVKATASIASKKNGMIGIFMDETLISAAYVNEKVDSDRIQIIGEEFNSNQEFAKVLAGTINAGSMPYEMEIAEIKEGMKSEE